MTIKDLIALAWMLGLFISPEALLLHGNMTGMSGFGFLLALGAGLLLHWFNVDGATRGDGTGGPPAAEIQLLTKAYGPFAASWLLLMARPVLATCIATAVLVTSGFVFNEVFLYWFPNFGFAALLLGLILIINLAGMRIAAMAQVLFTSTAVVGLLILILTGLLSWNSTPQDVHHTAFSVGGYSIGLAVLAFTGYDMLRYLARDSEKHQLAGVIKTGLIISGIVLIAWNLVALIHVAPSRLADTSIPHILTAKAIMGPAGRVMIGVVAIAGACAAVNYLFQSVARMTMSMSEARLLPSIFGPIATRPLLPLIILAATSGLLMAIGFAGSDLIDVSIRAGLLLWLAFYALLQLAHIRHRRRQHPTEVRPKGGTAPQGVIALAMLLSIFFLGAADESPGVLLKTLSVILAMTAFLAGSGLLMARGWAQSPTLAHANLKKGDKR